MGKETCNGEGCIRKRKDCRWKRFFMASYDLVAGKQKVKNFRARSRPESRRSRKKAIGVEHIRFPDLRHTFATLSLKNGVDVKTLSSTLRHYSAVFTLTTYPPTLDMMHQAADTMGNVIGQAI